MFAAGFTLIAKYYWSCVYVEPVSPYKCKIVLNWHYPPWFILIVAHGWRTGGYFVRTTGERVANQNGYRVSGDELAGIRFPSHFSCENFHFSIDTFDGQSLQYFQSGFGVLQSPYW